MGPWSRPYGVRDLHVINELDKVGDLVSAVGSNQFGLQFYRLFHELFAIEECTVFAFPPSMMPNQVVVEADCPDARQTAVRLAEQWVGGDYLIDENVRRYNKARTRMTYVLKPCEINDDTYRRRYYESPSICRELGLMARVNNTHYLMTLARRSHDDDFDCDDVRTFEALSGVILKTIHRHEELVAGKDRTRACGTAIDFSSQAQRDNAIGYLRDVLLGGPQRLSVREAEICSRIALGYSTLAISLHYGISLNTVATHRKRAYAKLGICSQNELFSRYMHLFGTPGALLSA